MDEQNSTAPIVPVSFNTKLGLGCAAALLIWMIFGPDSKPNPAENKAPAVATSQSSENRETRRGRYVMNGTRVRIAETVPGCASLASLKKFRQLATEGDRQAVVSMIDRQDCRLLDADTQVTVQDSSAWNGAECVRLPGDVDCLWTLTKSTEAPPGN